MKKRVTCDKMACRRTFLPTHIFGLAGGAAALHDAGRREAGGGGQGGQGGVGRHGRGHHRGGVGHRARGMDGHVGGDERAQREAGVLLKEMVNWLGVIT